MLPAGAPERDALGEPPIESGLNPGVCLEPDFLRITLCLDLFFEYVTRDGFLNAFVSRLSSIPMNTSLVSVAPFPSQEAISSPSVQSVSHTAREEPVGYSVYS